MFYKRLIGLVFAGALTFSAAVAEVVVKIRPPVAVVETRGPAPGPGYVWIGGYHRWDGNAYAWNAGRWERPPRHHAAGLRIAGFTAGAATFLLKGVGARRFSAGSLCR